MAPAIRQSMRALQGALALVYPIRCLLCDEPTAESFALCAACFSETQFIGGLSCDLCGVPLPGESSDTEICDDCLAMPRPWSRGRAAIGYDGAGRRLVLKLKHGDRPDLARTAVRWMIRSGQDCLDGTTLVPVPIHWSRRIARRYNQAAELARAVAQETGLPWRPLALSRTRATPGQDHRRVGDRFANLEGAIIPAAENDLCGRRVCLVDDVMTSGATLSACAAACHQAGAADVSVLVLARVVKRH